MSAPKHTEELATYLSKEIGYRIPGRGTIAALLGLPFLALLGTGIWFARRRELQYMGFVIPVVAILSTIAC